MKIIESKHLSGGQLAGGNPTNERVEYDFYATNPKAVEMLLEKYQFNEQGNWLECCVGQGHIANVIENKFNCKVTGIDIVDRGFPNTIVGDYLQWDTDIKFDNIISNPPYSLGGEFVEKSMELLNENGKLAMFLKIQFLEGLKRDKLYEDYPPKYIYVFRSRMATWNNGEKLDLNGKKWATTMCHAWYIWEKGYIGDTVVRRL